jgi:hypothetical protein
MVREKVALGELKLVLQNQEQILQLMRANVIGQKAAADDQQKHENLIAEVNRKTDELSRSVQRQERALDEMRRRRSTHPEN